MIKSTSFKAIVAITIIALIASMMGVIPSEKAIAAGSHDIDKITVGTILYSGDKILNSSDYKGLVFVNEFLKDFDYKNYDIVGDVSANYIKSSTKVPNAPKGYDSWKVVDINEYSSTGNAYDYTLYCAPAKSTSVTGHPKSAGIPKGKTAEFSVKSTTSGTKKTEYSWNQTSKTSIPFSFSGNGNEDYTTSGSIKIEKKAILSIPMEYVLNEFGYLYLYIYNDDYEYIFEEDGPLNKKTMVTTTLEPGTYNYDFYIDIYDGGQFKISDFQITYLDEITRGSNTLKISKYSPLYKSGNTFACMINNSLITDEAKLTISKAKLEKIHTPKKTIYLKKKQSLTLPVYAYKTDGTKEKLRFSSNKKKTATVNKKTGKVKAKKTGTATITAKSSSGKKYKIKIKVTNKKKKLKKLSIKGAPKSMHIGSTSYLSLTTKPAKATKVVAKWSSSNKKVISIAKNGRVEAKKAGKAKITAKIGKKKATKTITVY